MGTEPITVRINLTDTEEGFLSSEKFHLNQKIY